MSRGVDQVEILDLAVTRLVTQGCGLCLDGDAALALDLHRVKNLGLHLAVRETAAEVDDTIGQRRFAMVDMGNNGKITDVIHAVSKKGRFYGALPCSEDPEF